MNCKEKAGKSIGNEDDKEPDAIDYLSKPWRSPESSRRSFLLGTFDHPAFRHAFKIEWRQTLQAGRQRTQLH